MKSEKQFFENNDLDYNKFYKKAIELIRKYQHLPDEFFKNMLTAWFTHIHEYEYNCIINELESKNIIKSFWIESQLIWDSQLFIHGHLICDQCGKIENVLLDKSIFSQLKQDNRDIKFKESNMLFKGLCKKCKGVNYE